MNRSAEIQVKEICDWLSYQVRQMEASGAVFEVDGGIDSAVTAALARNALGENALALIMPCQSSQQTIEDALLVVNHVGLRHEVIDLNRFYNGLLHMLPKAGAEANSNMASRLRMMTLHHYGAARSCIVLGSGDRSDWEIGRLTKYGDDAADAFPIMHLLRKDIREMARFLNLPERIIQKAMFTGMLAGRKETHESGYSYEEVDAYLTGDFMQVSKPVQRKIREMQQAAACRRRSPARFAPLECASENETSLVEDHEAYDKSIEALTLISKVVTSDQYLEDILRLIVMVTAEVMNSSVCSLWLLDEKEGVLRLRATQSIDREYLKDRVLKVGEGIVGKVVEENRPYIVNNVLLDPTFKEKELARRMGLISMLSIPMRVGDRVIGVINCYTSHPHVFSDLQMNVLTAVANQAAVAIEKTELIVQTKVIQEELERRKVIERAKDLLMKRFELSGEEAYRWLQKRSMNTRKSMREVSEAVLLTMEG